MSWFLVITGWLLVITRWLLVTTSWFLVITSWLLVITSWLLVITRWFLVISTYFFSFFENVLIGFRKFSRHRRIKYVVVPQLDILAKNDTGGRIMIGAHLF